MSTRILAIDGPAGAGKSTIARRVALRLGWRYVDTGALYRTVALVSQQRGLDDEALIASLLPTLEIRFEGARVYVDALDVSQAIRTPEISTRSSLVSAMPGVRHALLDLQRRIAREDPLGAVLEGRDIGTVVFPDADLKIFLTASPEERARRRSKELAERGSPQPYDDVLAEMVARDQRDTLRTIAPLKPAHDAKIVDTTGKAIDEIVETIVSLTRVAGTVSPERGG